LANHCYDFDYLAALMPPLGRKTKNTTSKGVFDMTKKIIQSDRLVKSLGPFSQGVAWSGNKEELIFISGTTARNEKGEIVGKGDIKAQTVQVLENIKAVLEAAGATMDDVLKVNVYVKDMDHLAEINEVRSRYWKGNYPASALIAVKGFVNEDILIEIEAIAARQV